MIGSSELFESRCVFRANAVFDGLVLEGADNFRICSNSLRHCFLEPRELRFDVQVRFRQFSLI